MASRPVPEALSLGEHQVEVAQWISTTTRTSGSVGLHCKFEAESILNAASRRVGEKLLP